VAPLPCQWARSIWWYSPTEMWWHTVTYGRGSKGETGEPVLFALPRNMVYPALLPLMRTPRLPAFDWTDAPADLNGLVRFAERWNLVSARVPSHFKRSLLHLGQKRRGTLASDPCSGIRYQHFSNGESIASLITPWIWWARIISDKARRQTYR
jgi:hypothetical protein